MVLMFIPGGKGIRIKLADDNDWVAQLRKFPADERPRCKIYRGSADFCYRVFLNHFPNVSLSKENFFKLVSSDGDPLPILERTVHSKDWKLKVHEGYAEHFSK